MAYTFHTSIDKPLTIIEVMRNDDLSNLIEAMRLEFPNLIDKNTWELVLLFVTNGFTKSSAMQMD